MSKDKLPAFLFYPNDWLSDPALRRCSLPARAVWIDMLCLMFACDPRGVLVTGHAPLTKDEIATAVGGQKDVVRGCIDELLAKGVLSVREEDGAFWSRRMVRDEKRRRASKFNGTRGGRPRRVEPSLNLDSGDSARSKSSENGTLQAISTLCQKPRRNLTPNLALEGEIETETEHINHHHTTKGESEALQDSTNRIEGEFAQLLPNWNISTRANLAGFVERVGEAEAARTLRLAIQKRARDPLAYANGIVRREDTERAANEPRISTASEWKQKPYNPQ